MFILFSFAPLIEIHPEEATPIEPGKLAHVDSYIPVKCPYDEILASSFSPSYDELSYFKPEVVFVKQCIICHIH